MKPIKIILIVVLTIALLLGAFAIYYLTSDIESKIPKEIPATCELEVQEYMQRKVFIVKPKNTESKKTILYFHGGAYMGEATSNHWNFIEKIVNDTNATVILPDYPLAPKYNYKDVFQMIVPLYKEIIERVETNNLIIMGDSAGGGMSLALIEKLSEQKENLPSKTILISPWLDVRLENDEIAEVQKRDKELNKDALKLAGISYAGEDGMDSYLVNPIDGDLSKLENIYIFTGTNDILNPDAHLLIDKAQKAGTEINLKEYDGAAHIWLIENNCEKELVDKAYSDLVQLIGEECD